MRPNMNNMMKTREAAPSAPPSNMQSMSAIRQTPIAAVSPGQKQELTLQTIDSKLDKITGMLTLQKNLLLELRSRPQVTTSNYPRTARDITASRNVK
nr:unknown [Rice thrips mononega-like virus 1]